MRNSYSVYAQCKDGAWIYMHSEPSKVKAIQFCGFLVPDHFKNAQVYRGMTMSDLSFVYQRVGG